MPNDPVRELEDWVVRLEQSKADGKFLMSIDGMRSILKSVIRALKEK